MLPTNLEQRRLQQYCISTMLPCSADRVALAAATAADRQLLQLCKRSRLTASGMAIRRRMSAGQGPIQLCKKATMLKRKARPVEDSPVDTDSEGEPGRDDDSYPMKIVGHVKYVKGLFSPSDFSNVERVYIVRWYHRSRPNIPYPDSHNCVRTVAELAGVMRSVTEYQRTAGAREFEYNAHLAAETRLDIGVPFAQAVMDWHQQQAWQFTPLSPMPSGIVQDLLRTPKSPGQTPYCDDWLLTTPVRGGPSTSRGTVPLGMYSPGPQGQLIQHVPSSYEQCNITHHWYNNSSSNIE